MQWAEKKATSSVDEWCAFPLKLITITYQSLIFVGWYITLVHACDVPCLEMETMKCRVSSGCSSSFWQRKDIFMRSTFGFAERSNNQRPTIKSVWWSGRASKPMFFTSCSETFFELISLRTTSNIYWNSFSQRITKPFTRIVSFGAFVLWSDWLPFLSFTSTPMHLICSHFVTFL